MGWFVVMLAVDLLVNFLPMHVDLARGFDSEANFIATNLDNRDLNHVVDDDTFIFLPREY
jgi:hypothetical protein